ncbi:rhombosortase-dependent M36 family metallopeptidase [Pseudoalteromonas piscicida]|uniref:Peptidase n=1 Tax=Pseudoalteromonas piscicida TaxID=43662 RepID=A0A2A5JKI2_PSEO7|nr:rhombosortase-dependent M36 family metallopeptidase [Pseudoalteromonas piscicida]PCK29859.1 peptidase [Pseudoalteromonas piscicida]
MKNQFKPSFLYASIVFAMGTTGTVNATTALQFTGQVNNNSFFTTASSELALSKLPTASGMKSHYDSQLAKATFVWAPESIKHPNFSNIAKEDRVEHAANYYLNSLTGFNVTKQAISSDAELKDLHQGKRGTKIAKYQQTIDGIEVFNRQYNVIMDKEFNLVAGSGYFSAKSKLNRADLSTTYFATPKDAVLNASSDLGISANQINLYQEKTEGKYTSFEVQFGSNFKAGFKPRSKKVYFDTGSELVAANYVEIEVFKENSVEADTWAYVIDSRGKILHKHSLIAHDSEFTYRVYANEDGYPMEGPHGNVIPKLDEGPDKTEILPAPLVTLSSFSKLSTGDAWLSEDATITKGNNVFAYADVVAPDGFTEGDFTAEITSAKTFDYVLDNNQSPNSTQNRKAAIVNLFYMNNFLHDFFYDYGFDEKAGNAQMSNYGRGGEENDPLHVQAQDHSGLNNANMSTPADGRSPRMQQYLWNSKDAKLGIDFGITLDPEGNKLLLESTQIAGFGARQFDVTEVVARVDDGEGTSTDGCQTTVNAAEISGKIALIDRGGCSFTDKVKFVQEAGAIGAIVVNNNDDGTPAPMGGEDDSVSLPSMGLSFADGHLIYDMLEQSETVTVNMSNAYLLKDSTFDNGIIAHEWGHYISNRLVGNSSGLTNFQGRAMGEGWGDFHSLMFLALESDLQIAGNDKFQIPYATGTFVEDFTRGIRRAPYTTDMSINPLTFKHIESGATPNNLPPTSVASPHAPGEIWAVVLWEVYVALINKHGFQEAQDRMAVYLIEGYKATPIEPTYTEARDAILSSIYASDQQDFDLALAAFAKRGMGLGAVSPERSDDENRGVVESYSTEIKGASLISTAINTSFTDETAGYCSNDNVLDINETAALKVSVKNAGNEPLNNVKAKIEVTSDHDVELENDGVFIFDTISPLSTVESAYIKATLKSAGIADTLTYKVTFPELADDEVLGSPELTATLKVNYDFELEALDGYSATADMENLTSLADFKESVMFGGTEAVGTVGFDTSVTNLFAANNPGIDFGESTLFLKNNSFQSDVAAQTLPFEVGYGGDFTISFWHLYFLEDNWDGAVVEISINGGNWIDVTSKEAGGTFRNGYNADKLIDNDAQTLQNRPVFTGRNDWGEVEEISFGDNLDGQTVRFRFRLASDSASAALGWFIDQVEINNIASPIFHSVISGESASCDNSAPIVNLQDEFEMSESEVVTLAASATDRNNDTLKYSWTQVEGPEATLMGENTSTLSVTAPFISQDAELTFKLVVSDEQESVTTYSTLLVKNEAPTVELPEALTTSEQDSAVQISAKVSNRADEPLTYSWVQLDGPEATISGYDSSKLVVTPPNVSNDTDLTFEVTVSNGSESASAQTVLTVTNVSNNAGVTDNSSSSSGSFGWFMTLLGAFGLFRARRR